MSRPSLYELLPAYVRYRDGLEGEPLRRVMEALEIPYRALLEDVEALYDGWFIETCDLWRVPYVADLLGVRGLGDQRNLVPSQRTRVANTLAYRRHKGTAAALERAASDATGWSCCVVEYARTTARTASLRTGATAGRRSPGFVDVRRADDLDPLGTPFNVVAHGGDLRPSPPGSPPVVEVGGFLPTQVGLAFHRLGAYPVEGGVPRRVGEGHYTFHPFGIDVPLFNPRRTSHAAVYRSREDMLPVPLRTLPLQREIEDRRRGEHPATNYLGEVPAWRIFVAPAAAEEEAEAPLPESLLLPEEMEVCDLEDWTPPPPSAPGVRVFVDPHRGRLCMASGPDGREERPVRVDYHHGAVGDLGGGSYPRSGMEGAQESAELRTLDEEGDERPVRTEQERLWTAVVARDATPRFDRATGIHHFRSLDQALAAWSQGRRLPIPAPSPASVAPRDGRILIADSATYPVGEPLELRGRRLRIEALEGCVPCLVGDLEVLGPRRRTETRSRESVRALALRNRLTLAGLWIDGGLRITGGVSLAVEHCTLDPPRSGRSGPCALSVHREERETRADLRRDEPSELHAFSVRIRHSIVGPILLDRQAVDLEIDDSLVDGGAGGAAVLAGQGQVRLLRCSLLGRVEAGRLTTAADSLFTGPLEVAVRGEGVVMSCRVPEGSRTPVRKHCVDGIVGDEGSLFTSTTYGRPGYGQLTPAAGEALLTGAGDGNEIGVYNTLRQEDRLANLDAVLENDLPWGTGARVWFVT